MRKISCAALGFGVALALAGAVPCAASNMVTYLVTSPNGGNPVDATAQFSINPSGYLMLTLTNWEANIVDVGQAVTGIKFNLTTSVAGITPGNQPTGTGDVVTVGSAGSVSDSGLQSVMGYYTASTSLHTVFLSVFSTGGPNGAILGPETSGSYPDANGSLASNGPHNPFVNDSATFTFGDFGNLTGDNLSNILSAVQIEFGTSQTNYFAASVVASPEPSSVIFFFSGVLLFAAKRKRRQDR
jgi:hypothetical protein